MTLLRTAIEHWDAPEADGGTVVSRIGYGNLLGGTQLDRAVDGTGRVRVVVPFNNPGATGLVMRQIIRAKDPVAGTFEHRINKITRNESVDAATILVTALPIILDLVDYGYLFDDSGGVRDYNIGELTLTPAQWIDTWLLGSLTTMGITHWDRGTTDFSDPITLTVSNFTSLALLRAIEGATGGEVRARFNDATSILIDLIDVIGDGSATPLLKVGRSLTKLVDSQQQQKMATVVIPIRGFTQDGVVPQSIDQFVARVTAQDTGYIEIEDPTSSADLIIIDDEFNDWYAVRPDTGALIDITDSVAANQRLVLTSTGFAVGDIIEFRANGSGDRIAEVRHPANITLYGRRALQLERPEDDVGGRNYVLNPEMTEWADSDYAHWVHARAAEAIGAAETDWDLDNILTDEVLPDPTPVGFVNGTKSFPPQSTGGGTVAGGAITVTADDNPHASVLNNEHMVMGHHQNALPDGWYPMNNYIRIADGLGLYLQSFFAIDLTEDVSLVDGVTQDGAANFLQSGQSGGDALHVDLSDLPADIQIQPGYAVDWDGESQDAIVIDRKAADGSGDIHVDFIMVSNIGNVADGADAEIHRPDWPTAVGRSTGRLITMGARAAGVGTDTGMISPDVYIRVQAGWVLRARWEFAAANNSPANQVFVTSSGPKLCIIDTDGDNLLASVQDEERTWIARTIEVVAMTIDHTLLAGGNIAVGLVPGAHAGARTMAAFMTATKSISLSYEPQGYDLEGVEFSAANDAFNAANRALLQFGVLPRVFTVTLRDLAYDDRFVMADEKLTLGGNVRLFSSRLGIDQEARVMRIVHDVVAPLNTKVTLDTEPLRITEAF